MPSIRSFFGSKRSWSLALLVLVATALTAGATTYAFLRTRQSAIKTEARADSAIPTASDYKTLPVYFEPNRGQTDPRVRFLSRGPGYTVFLTRDGTVLSLRKISATPAPSKPKTAPAKSPDVTVTTSAVWLNLAGARPDAKVEGIDPLPGRVNYFIGNDSSKWHTDIPTYARVRYRSVYPGIDLVYYGTPEALEYDLIAAPGADPRAIRLELQGAERTHVDSSGDLVISTPAGDLTMRRPRVYQDTLDGQRHLINAHYLLTGAPRVPVITLSLAEHDSRLPLVIDPEIVYSTYVGGKGDRSGPIQGFPSIPSQITSLDFSDGAISLALGPDNTVYVTGIAYSSNFPATPGSYQSTNQASPNTTPNGFVAKFDTTKSGANSLLYSTYLGGSGCSTSPCTPGHDGDQGTGVAVDTTGDAYVSGLTYSKNFPNPNCGSFGTANNAGAVDINNGFVAELNPSGGGLIYSCFIHGSDGAPATGIAIKPGCASNCAAYVVGNTTSQATTDGKPDFPILNAYQATNPDTNENSAGFVTVVNGGGGSLMYSSFLGGTGTTTGGESLARIAVDTSGRLYVTGASFSSDYPTKNAFQSINNGSTAGVENAVVSSINPSASGTASLLYSTYLGGSGLTIPFVGSFGDIAAGIALDSSNDIYVAGVATSSDFPTDGAKPAYQPDNNAGGFGGANGFVSELNPSLSPVKQLVYSTYLGGPADLFGSPIRPGDAATDVTVDSTTGKIFVAGGATSAEFPVANTCSQMSTIGPDDQADAFVSILDPNVTPASAQLQFSTYLGGSMIDVASAIARDTTNKIYVVGVTFSGDFPVTMSAFQFGNNAFAAGTTNAFVTELDPSSTVCPTPFPSPSITATSTPTAKPTPTPTAKPTSTPTKSPTATPTVVPGTPVIKSIPSIVEVGAGFTITGSGFTDGSVVNFFVATGGPVFKTVLNPVLPHGATSMTVNVPTSVPLGSGFTSLEVVNTDTGYKVSNPAYALLQANPAAGIPTITSINHVDLAATSSNPSYATNNVETLVEQGTTVTLGGMGFRTGTKAVAVNVFCACTGGKVGPFYASPTSSTSFSFALPAVGLPNSPNTGPGSFVVINTTGSFPNSNAVSAPIGALIHVLSVKQTGSNITVTGSGFSTLTVINFFNLQTDGTVKNFGGLNASGKPYIPLTLTSDTMFSFTVPTGAVPNPAYVQAINPPYVPYSSSRNDPGGSFTLGPF